MAAAWWHDFVQQTLDIFPASLVWVFYVHVLFTSVSSYIVCTFFCRKLWDFLVCRLEPLVYVFWWWRVLFWSLTWHNISRRRMKHPMDNETPPVNNLSNSQPNTLASFWWWRIETASHDIFIIGIVESFFLRIKTTNEAQKNLNQTNVIILVLVGKTRNLRILELSNNGHFKGCFFGETENTSFCTRLALSVFVIVVITHSIFYISVNVSVPCGITIAKEDWGKGEKEWLEKFFPFCCSALYTYFFLYSWFVHSYRLFILRSFSLEFIFVFLVDWIVWN